MTFRDQLKALGYTTYADYLASDHWQQVKDRFYDSGLWKHHCLGCRTTTGPFHVHHRSYKRIGRERLTDLVGVCAACHLAIHKSEKAHPTRGLWRSTTKALGSGRMGT